MYASRSLQNATYNAQLARVMTPELIERGRTSGFSIAELLIAATQFNPSLAEARAKIAAADAAMMTARAVPNPTVGLSGEYDLSRAEESPWLFGLSTEFPIDGALRRKLRTQIANAGVRAARLEYAETLWSVRRQLRATLLALAIAERRVEVLTATANDRSRLVELLARRVALGESASGERLQAALEFSRTRTALAQARQQQRDARVQLATLIGIPLAAIESVRFRFDDLDTPALPEPSRLDELRNRALLSRADLEKAIVDYQNRELELRKAIRDQYPTFAIGPGYTYDHGIRKATLGVSLSLPIFNRNRGPIAEAEAQRALAEARLLSAQAQIFNEVDAAVAAARASVDELNGAREQRVQSQALVDTTDRELTIGATDRPALLAARLSAAEDELALLDTQERAQRALGELEDALRSPLSGPELALHFSTESLND